MAKKQSLAKLKNQLQLDADKMDKYLDYYLNGTPLDAEGVKMLERYRKAWSWYSRGQTKEMIWPMLMKEYDIQERQARYILAESIFLHGSTGGVDKAGQKVASASFFRLLANMAMMNGEIDAATRAWDKADHMDGLHDEEKVGWDPDAFKKPSKFVFINNVNVLQQQLKQQMEDDE